MAHWKADDKTKSLLVVMVTFLVVPVALNNGSETANVRNDYTCDNFPDYGAYINQWRVRFPRESGQLYPMGETYCDTLAVDIQREYGLDPGIQFNVPFYGKVYTSLWVSPSGFISLGQKSPASPIPFFWIDQWPNAQYPMEGALDPPIIAPFYSETSLFRPQPEPSQLTYRILDPSRVSSNTQRLVMEGMLGDMSVNVRGAVLGAEKFLASYGIVVTWYKVTFAINDCQPANNNCNRNTFQAVILTDGTETYTIFNYYEMTWVGGGGDQNCDRTTGRRSTNAPNCKPGHMGFNAGEARQFYALPYSGKDTITRIAQEGGSNVTGRFYYKVSGDTIVQGGCTNFTDPGDVWKTEIYPKSGGMLGGTVVNISGPCFTNTELVRCRYDDFVTEAVSVDNIMRITCVSPLMSKVGAINVAVSVDGNNFNFETEYIVVTPDHISPQVTITRQEQNWLQPEEIELKWSPEYLSPRPNDRVNIKLFGYREDSSSGTPQGIWDELHVLAPDYSNTGVYLLQPSSFPCDYNAEGQKCTTYDIGAFQISLEYANDNPANPRRIWSRVIPLGWYIKDAMVQDRGSNWIKHKCDVWYYDNNKATSWPNELHPCPCTFQQAYTDFGRFQPDPLCKQGGIGERNCERHQGASHCVISTRSGSSGSGNQCCYDSRNELIHSGDTMFGSRPQRSHVWGSPPYSLPPRIPKLSHWVKDVTGFYYCCRWHSSDSDCHNYLQLRSTRSCHNYLTSGQAAAFGDPHFKTFEGVFYTFNGFGEYWLMQVQNAEVDGQVVNFKLHGRFEQPANQSWGQTKGTQMTAVGMQLDDKQMIVLETNAGGFQKKLLVHINDYLLDLTKIDLRRQEFDDFVVINNDALTNEQATNFTIVYRCGVGINVVWKNNLLDVIVSAPPEFKHFSRGLFGRWNDDPTDDLEPKNPGGPAFSPEETERVHYLFGETWRVTNSESCFRYLYRAQLNHAYYNREYFVPNFSPKFPPNSSGVSDEMVNTVCNGELACTFDYKTTLNDAVGRNSKLVNEWDQHRRLMGQKVFSCGWLPVPFSRKQEPISYLVGSVVRITGCVDQYILEGPTEYKCLNNSNGNPMWSPAVTTRCRGPGDPLPTTTVLAIAIPAALGGVLVIIAIVVIILVVRKKRKEKRRSNENKQAMADFMGGRADTFTISPPAPTKKPPRPELNRSKESLDIKHEYENKMNLSGPTNSSGGSSANHVSWDTQDGDKLSENTKPLKQSTLKSQKTDISMDPSSPSPKAKKKRPYQYPTESRDNSLEDWRSNVNESPTLKIRSEGPGEPTATYRPRDVHSYSKGHNIPTAGGGASNYYKKKYGRYNNTSFA